MSLVSTVTSGSLVPREYTSFRGVDFSNKEVNLVRSPDSLNMWKNYKQLAKCIETRPSESLYLGTTGEVYGLYFFTIGTRLIPIIHIGTKLYTYEDSTLTEIYSGMNPKESRYFVFNNILFIMDGLNYLEYDGSTCKSVVGTIPTTYILIAMGGGGSKLNDINMLSDYMYLEAYGDGESSDLVLPLTIDTDSTPEVTLTDTNTLLVPGTDFTWANEADAQGSIRGVIKFTNVPDKPLNDGEDNIKVKIKHSVSGNREKVTHCTLSEVFDDRVFVSGNIDYPRAMWHSEGEDFRYFSETDYYNEGLDNGEIKGMVAGNGALWVFKTTNNSNNSIYYHLPYDVSLDDETTERRYTASTSNVATGCVGKTINFNDDIVFFSNRGMEAINSTDMDSEQVLAHRSSLVDSKLLNETNYKNMKLIEWEGYLLIAVGNSVYLANGREMFTNDTHNEYEFFYWELNNNVNCLTVYDETLYIGTPNGIYTLNDVSTTREINSYWSTPEDEFKAPHYQKTTNKKGCTVVMDGEKIKVSVRTDNNAWEEINEYANTKGYVVARIKKKKWRTIQMKYSASKPISLYSSTLESYVGAYTKR